MMKIMNENKSEKSIISNLILPVILFATTGAFGFAIRGQAGFGAVPGCVFFGLLIAMVWFLLSHEETEKKQRRYSLGWSVVALIMGLGMAGSQGWMQWPAWVGGRFYTDYTTGAYINISPAVGLTWVFIAGVHWVGFGVIFLAWTGSKIPLKPVDWVIRIVFGVVGAGIAYGLYITFPQLFLPNYDVVNYTTCPQCVRIIGDIRLILVWTGMYLGFLAYEIVRKDWHNVKFITVVSIITGILWMIFMYTWQVAVPNALPDVSFNWWRCWETSGGIGIGVALGIGFYIYNKKLPDNHPMQREMQHSKYRNGERLIGVYFALALALAYSVMNGIKGWLHIQFPNYPELNTTQLAWALPVSVLIFMIWFSIVYVTMKNPFQLNDGKDNLSDFTKIFIPIYVIHRVIGLGVTWSIVPDISETAFFIYYLVLSGIDFTILAILAKKRKPTFFKEFKSLFRFNFGRNTGEPKPQEENSKEKR